MDARTRRERIIAESAEWWVMLQDPMSQSQREQFVDWLRESVLHVAEMLRIAHLHGTLEQFDSWTRIPVNTTPSEGGTVISMASTKLSRSDGGNQL